MQRILLLVMVLVQAGCITEVSDTFTKNIDREKFIETSVQAGTQYMQAGQTDNAFRHLNKALEADPRSSEANTAMAMLYQYTGDQKLAEKHFEQALRYDRKNSQANNNYASLLYEQKRYEKAIKYLERASKDPAYSKRDVAFENIGHCYLKLNQPEKAQTAYRQALRINSNLPRPYLELADLAWQNKQYQKANRALKAFAKLQRHTARSLWLGIRLERILGGADQLASYALALKNLYPNSQEYALFQGLSPLSHSLK